MQGALNEIISFIFSSFIIFLFFRNFPQTLRSFPIGNDNDLNAPMTSPAPTALSPFSASITLHPLTPLSPSPLPLSLLPLCFFCLAWSSLNGVDPFDVSFFLLFFLPLIIIFFYCARCCVFFFLLCGTPFCFLPFSAFFSFFPPPTFFHFAEIKGRTSEKSETSYMHLSIVA
jgi:hypothetical protein